MHTHARTQGLVPLSASPVWPLASLPQLPVPTILLLLRPQLPTWPGCPTSSSSTTLLSAMSLHPLPTLSLGTRAEVCADAGGGTLSTLLGKFPSSTVHPDLSFTGVLPLPTACVYHSEMTCLIYWIPVPLPRGHLAQSSCSRREKWEFLKQLVSGRQWDCSQVAGPFTNGLQLGRWTGEPLPLLPRVTCLEAPRKPSVTTGSGWR